MTIEAYFQVLEMAPVPVMIWNPDGILYANRQASILIGYDNSDLLKMEIGDLVEASDLEEYTENARLLAGEEPGTQFSIRVVIRTKNGQKMHVELVEAITPTDESYIFSTIIKDLAGSQRQIERHLKRVDALTQNITNLERKPDVTNHPQAAGR